MICETDIQSIVNIEYQSNPHLISIQVLGRVPKAAKVGIQISKIARIYLKRAERCFVINSQITLYPSEPISCYFKF